MTDIASNLLKHPFKEKTLLKMKKTTYLLIMLASILMSCSKKSIHFYSEYESNIDFKQYKTFAWKPTVSPTVTEDGEIIEWNVKNYVTESLKERGMHIDVANPSVLFDYEVDFEQGITQSKVMVYSKYPHNYKDTTALSSQKSIYRRSKRVGKELKTIGFEEAGLIIYMIDKNTHALLWKGYCVEKVKDNYDFEKNLSAIIQKIMLKYPISPVKK
ncbi:MAG: hypothetical protein RL711_569 [Bacteroidota bacterium]|jgi:hypothetical protein